MKTIKIPEGVEELKISQESGRVVIEFAPRFKEGDFVYEDERIMIVHKCPHFYKALVYPPHYTKVHYNGKYGLPFSSPSFRFATEEEKQFLLDALEKDGEKWNAEKLCIEDIPVYKKGDIVTYKYPSSDKQGVLIFNRYGHSSIHSFAAINRSDILCLNDSFGDIDSITITGIANEEYSSKLFSALKNKGKQWNPTKLCIEDIPQRKFKPGDKVRLKDGMLDKRWESPYFKEEMDVFIGKVLTVGRYTSKGYIYMKEGDGWAFAEAWLEPYSDEPIVGELAIFWDFCKEHSHIRLCTQRIIERYCDHAGILWENAIKFESKEQFLEHIKD